MQVAMRRPPAARHNFFAFLTRDEFVPLAVMEPDFDEDAFAQPLTAEPLDWHECREWPAIAAD